MNLKIAFSSNFKSQLQTVWFFFISSLFLVMLIKSGDFFDNFLLSIFISVVAFVFTWQVFITLRCQTITINKNFFIITTSFFFKQKYVWKDVVNIEEMYMERVFDGETLDSHSSYVVLELTNKSIQTSVSLNEHKNVFIKVDTVTVDDESLEDKAFRKMSALADLLTFFKEQYSYVDIHSPEIDRSEVLLLLEELSELGVVCQFST